MNILPSVKIRGLSKFRRVKLAALAQMYMYADFFPGSFFGGGGGGSVLTYVSLGMYSNLKKERLHYVHFLNCPIPVEILFAQCFTIDVINWYRSEKVKGYKEISQ